MSSKTLLTKRENVMQLTELERMLFEMDDNDCVTNPNPITSVTQPLIVVN
jgi:hypothetical protein